MTQDDYISDRLETQIGWYDTKSQIAQRTFKALRSIEVISAASIPVVAGFSDMGSWGGLAVAILGAAVASIAAFIGLGNYQENWVQYRGTCEALRHEKYLFLTRSAPYNTDSAFAILVPRIESMVSAENATWSQSTRAAIGKPSDGTGGAR